MRMEWQTPIYHTNYAAFHKGSLQHVHARLSAEILRHFRALAAAHPETSVSGYRANGINQAFFEWQRDGGWARHFAPLPDIKQLTSFLRFAASALMQSIGNEEPLSTDTLYAWATVHYDCISHLPHTHPENALSAVYYVSVPDDAGPIIFSDPRGPLPPFDNTVTVFPKAGDLLIFPSWLLHQVGPTRGLQERISIAFNIPGDWATTAGVSAHMPIDTLE